MHAIHVQSTRFRAISAWSVLIVAVIAALFSVGCGSSLHSVKGYKTAPGFDLNRARIDGPNLFYPFKVKDAPVSLKSQDLDPEDYVVVLERGGKRLALSAQQMNYHHLAQGELAGEPYLVSY